MKRDMTSLKAIIKADYHRHVKRFENLSPSKEIVFIGDSIVAYFPLKTMGLGDDIFNLGIPGDTTKGVYERVDQVLRLKPKHVILHVGLNDEVLLDHRVGQTVSTIKRIIDEIHDELIDVKITLVSLTPINQSSFPHSTYVVDRNPKFAMDVNKEMMHIKGIEYLNIYDVLLDDNHELDRRFSTDGIHLNEQGYTIYQIELENIL